MKFLMLACVEDSATGNESESESESAAAEEDNNSSFPWLDEMIARGIRLDGDRLRGSPDLHLLPSGAAARGQGRPDAALAGRADHRGDRPCLPRPGTHHGQAPGPCQEQDPQCRDPLPRGAAEQGRGHGHGHGHGRRPAGRPRARGPAHGRGHAVGYHLLPATRADLLRRLGRHADTVGAYRQALDLTANEAERRFLTRRLAEVTALGG